MEVKFCNRKFQEGYWELEWKPNRFFDGPFCEEADLKNVDPFTEADRLKLKILLNESKNIHLTNHPRISTEMNQLELKQMVTRLEGTMYSGKVVIYITFGYPSGDYDVYEQCLTLQGDKGLILLMLPQIVTSELEQEPHPDAPFTGKAAFDKAF